MGTCSHPEKLSILAGMALFCTALTFEFYAFTMGVTATAVLCTSSLWKNDRRTLVSGFMVATPLAWGAAFMSAINTWSRALMSHCHKQQEEEVGESSTVMGSDNDFQVNLVNDTDTASTATTSNITKNNNGNNGNDGTNFTFFCDYKNLLVGSAAVATVLWVMLGLLTYRVSSQHRSLLLNDTDGGDTIAMDDEEDQSECMSGVREANQNEDCSSRSNDDLQSTRRASV